MGANVTQRELKLKAAFNDKFISARFKFQVLSGRGLWPDLSTPFQRKPHFNSDQNLAEVEEHHRSVHMAIHKS